MEIEELHVTWDDIIHLLPQLIIGLLFFIKPNMVIYLIIYCVDILFDVEN